MTATLRDSVPMLVGLALLTAAGYVLVSATGRSWFEHDVQMRAELAVRGARRGLASGWERSDHKGIEQLLDRGRDRLVRGGELVPRRSGADRAALPGGPRLARAAARPARRNPRGRHRGQGSIPRHPLPRR